MTETLYAPIRLSPELIQEFMADFTSRSKSKTSVYTYQKRLEQFYELLPADKTIGPGTLMQIRENWITQGVPNRSINLSISTVNSLLEYCNRRDLQLSGCLAQTAVISPELTRAEYLRLLSVARTLEKERGYLLVKVFANTGLYVRELTLLTVEAVKSGRIPLPERGIVPIPPLICQELLRYCQKNGQTSGPVFVTREGKPIHRSAVNTEIRRLAGDAQVEESKCNPITLRRLYLTTREQISSSFAVLIEQSHERLLETEQLSVGWE